MSVFYYKYSTYTSLHFSSLPWLAAFVTLNDETLASLIKQTTIDVVKPRLLHQIPSELWS